MYHRSSSRSKLSLRVPEECLVASDSYVLTFEAQRFYGGCRYFWMICSTLNPDELVSWGYAATRELAEVAAQSEVEKLESGSSETGRVRERTRRRQ
jgi:hypothetical protein